MQRYLRTITGFVFGIFSSNSIEKTIQMLQFVKDGVKDSSKRDESLKKCIPIAEGLANDYKELAKKADTLQDAAVKAVVEIEMDNLKISNKKKKDAEILNKLKSILSEAKKIETAKGCNSMALSNIAEVMNMIKDYNRDLSNDFEIALTAMSSASVSMKIIKTMALDINDYWMDQVSLIKKVIPLPISVFNFLFHRCIPFRALQCNSIK